MYTTNIIGEKNGYQVESGRAWEGLEEDRRRK